MRCTKVLSQHDLEYPGTPLISIENLKLVLMRQNGVFVLLLPKIPQRASCWLHWDGVHRLYLTHLVLHTVPVDLLPKKSVWIVSI